MPAADIRTKPSRVFTAVADLEALAIRDEHAASMRKILEEINPITLAIDEIPPAIKGCTDDPK